MRRGRCAHVDGRCTDCVRVQWTVHGDVSSTWDREVLERCYDYVDGTFAPSLLGKHPRETKGAVKVSGDEPGDGSADRGDRVGLRHGAGAEAVEQISYFLSFDSWNVWYRARNGDAVNGHRTQAPHLLEEPYNLEDALLVGGLVNSLIRHSDRVKVACLVQLVNVIAPIMTDENGILRNTIYFPYVWGLKYGRGRALSIAPEEPAMRWLHWGDQSKTLAWRYRDLDRSNTWT